MQLYGNREDILTELFGNTKRKYKDLVRRLVCGVQQNMNCLELILVLYELW